VKEKLKKHINNHELLYSCMISSMITGVVVAGCATRIMRDRQAVALGNVMHVLTFGPE
jgi:hypothetical protein